MIVALVCGGRTFSDKDFLFKTLDTFRFRGECITHVITGSQRLWQGGYVGADHFAEEWAKRRCLWYAGLPADWRAFGPPAGPVRNGRMLDEAPWPIDVVIAFPGGIGTENMMKRAWAAGIEVCDISLS